MMLILVVYYVIIAFLIGTYVIAGPASVPTKNGSSSIIVLNACSQDPPCFVSCIIGFGDVKLYRSPILGSAEKSYFPYANTTIGLHVTIFKHIDVQDPGTVIITKKLGDDEDTCFAVRGDYSTPKISKCLNGLGLAETNKLEVTNLSSPPFIVRIQLLHGTQIKAEKQIYGAQSTVANFELTTGTPSGFVSFSVFKRKSESSAIFEPIKQTIAIKKAFDMCIHVTGSYDAPDVSSVVCHELK